MIDQVYESTLRQLEFLFHEIVELVPVPEKRPYLTSFVFRPPQETLEAAAVLKLAAVVSCLNASLLLLRHGFVQELGALERMMDEWEEDIQFLAVPLLGGRRTDFHERFLKDFYQEEFDVTVHPPKPAQKRDRIPRRKIRAEIANHQFSASPSRFQTIVQTIYNSNSGYVHGAAPHIMDIFGGIPPKFQVAGYLVRRGEHAHNFWNYVYRGIMSAGLVALCLGAHEKCARAIALCDSFQRQTNRNC